MPDINPWPRPKGIVVTSAPNNFELKLPAAQGAFMQLSFVIGLALLLVLAQATKALVDEKLGQPSSPIVVRAVPVLLMWATVGAILLFCGSTFLRAWRRQLRVTVSGDTFCIGYVGFWFDRPLSIRREDVVDVSVRVYASGGEGPEQVLGGILVIEYRANSSDRSSVRFGWPGLCPSEWRWVRDALRNELDLPPM